MTQTLILPSDLAATEAELARPCACDDCVSPATWMGWARHTQIRCPHTFYLCDDHKRQLIEMTEQQLHRYPIVCFRCFMVDGVMRTVDGQLSDNLRFIEL